MAKKTWRITIESDVYFGIYLGELKNWHVNPSLYRVEGNSVITSNNNVIDVATETFLNHLTLLKIEAVEQLRAVDASPVSVLEK